MIRSVTLFKSLQYNQLLRMFPGKETKTKALLTNLLKQGRIRYDQDSGFIYANEELSIDQSLIMAFWVLLDFFSRAEYYTASEYPVQIIFFTEDGETYEIIYVPFDREALISNACKADGDSDSKRLVIVDKLEQVKKIRIENVVSFCTVNETGKVNYYNFKPKDGG